MPGKAEQASGRSRWGSAPRMASAGETESERGPQAGAAGGRAGEQANERAPGWLVFSALLPPHTALQPSLLPSWLLIRTQPQAEARVTPSAGAPAAARGSLPASPKCRLQGRGVGSPTSVRGCREAGAVAWRAAGPG